MGLTEPSPNKKSKATNYYKYSGLAFQMLAAIGIAGWLGYLLDNYLAQTFPAFMLLFGFMAFGGMMYQIYRSINRDNP
jgi:F0F1-type ATP synthase assembly protein I